MATPKESKDDDNTTRRRQLLVSHSLTPHLTLRSSPMGQEAAEDCKGGYRVRHNSRFSYSTKLKDKEEKGKVSRQSYHLKDINNDFIDLDLGNSSSTSSMNFHSELDKIDSIEELKRGSIYQSSNTVRRMHKMGVLEEKKRIPSRHSDISVSYSIIDSLSRPTRNQRIPPVHHHKEPELIALDLDLNSASAPPNDTQKTSPRYLNDSAHHFDDHCRSHSLVVGERSLPNDFLEFSLDSERQRHEQIAVRISEPMEKGLMETQPHVLEDDGSPRRRGTIFTLSKSLSEKVKIPNSPTQFLSNGSNSRPNAKGRFSPFRKLLDPIRKSKSQRSMPVSGINNGEALTSSPSPKLCRNLTLRKCLLQDFSKTALEIESDGYLVKKDPDSLIYSSPVHLHGLLKLEHKHGVPHFKFVLKEPEDVLSAKTWRTDKAFNWVYTFHSLNNKKTIESDGRGSKDRHKQSKMLGQMQVSCYLCSEIRNGRPMESSTMMEYILYDTAQQGKSFSSQEGSLGSHADINAVSPHLWLPRDMHSHLELAAIMIQVPTEVQECFTNKIQGEGGGKEYPNTSSDSSTDQGTLANVKVITPSGPHGLPASKEGRPSPLLDRWRSGGGCDCGGWDMNCPIVVLDRTPAEIAKEDTGFQSQSRIKLFVQGTKEKVPALTIKVVDDSQYAVDFHAQLSSLQAFSICVALLHSEEISVAISKEKNNQKEKCNSLNTLLEEELRLFIEAVAEEEKRKNMKKVEEIPPPFPLDPPFSPIGRV